MKRKGSMTIFFCLMLLMISAIICTCLESARTAGVRFIAKTATGSALQSVFADYHSKLWEDYHVFFHHETGNLEDAIQEYLEYYTDPGKGVAALPEYADIWNISAGKAVITGSRTALADGGSLFLKQAVEYEKYQVAASMLEALAEHAGLLDEAEKLRSFAARLGSCFEQVQRVCTLYQEIRDGVTGVIECANRAKELLKRERITGAEAQQLVQSAVGWYGGLNRYMEDYLREAETVSQVADELRQEYGSEEGAIYGQQIQQLEKLTAAGEIGGAVSRIYPGISEIYGQLVGLQSELQIWLEVEDGGDFTEICKRIQEAIEADVSRIQGLGETGEPEAGDDAAGESGETAGADTNETVSEEEDNQAGRGLLEQVRQWKNMAVLNLAMGEAAAQTRTDYLDGGDELPSAAAEEPLEDVSLVDKALFIFYISDTFTSALSGEQKGFAYQQEYILFGRTDSRGNLTAMAGRLFAVREGLNLAFLLTDGQMRARAGQVASALVGAAALYPLVLITEFVLLAAWAFAESVVDVRALFRGETVPLWKSAADWKTDIGGMGSVTEREIGEGPELSYEDYLKLFLMVESSQKLCVRAMDMVQQEISRSQPGFRLADCYGEAEVSVLYSSPLRLIVLPFIGGLPGQYQISVDSAYQYP